MRDKNQKPIGSGDEEIDYSTSSSEGNRKFFCLCKTTASWKYSVPRGPYTCTAAGLVKDFTRWKICGTFDLLLEYLDYSVREVYTERSFENGFRNNA